MSTTAMTTPRSNPDDGWRALSPEDARVLDALLAGDASAEVDPARSARLRGVLGMLDRWETGDPPPRLAQRTVAAVIAADPVALSAEDGEALDALLALRRRGQTTGPMPAGSAERAANVSKLLSLLDRADDEPIPEGLAARTMQAVQAQGDRRRLTIGTASDAGRWRASGGSIRQVATTAALLLMVLSVLLPVLDKSRRDAGITACNANLAGLGVDLQRFANDNKAVTHEPATPAIFNHLSGFARSPVEGRPVPAHTATLFVLLDKQHAPSEHRACPSAEPGDPAAFYNGQNPVAGGPFRVFLEPRPIFADTNPLYRVTPAGLVRDVSIPGMTQSKNHDGVGQNVLISDGSVFWKVRPAVTRTGRDSADNIWLYQPPRRDDPTPDVFLTP